MQSQGAVCSGCASEERDEGERERRGEASVRESRVECVEGGVLSLCTDSRESASGQRPHPSSSPAQAVRVSMQRQAGRICTFLVLSGPRFSEAQSTTRT
mmetsp:Transcript_5279/g.12686  ORF Transcript_5279/g.12686 Transcript_5279/m.12686 type:complete len:99 (+) Transcript_5279:842-1138(+)